MSRGIAWLGWEDGWSERLELTMSFAWGGCLEADHMTRKFVNEPQETAKVGDTPKLGDFSVS